MEYKFSELFKWESGKPISISEGDIPVYGSNGIIGYTDKQKYNNKIILGRVGAYCGSVSYCKTDFNATDNTLITTCDTNKILYYYAYYLLKLYDLNRYAGGSAQPLITQSILKHLKCDIPNLGVQHKIASILSAYDSLIENNTKRICLLEQMAENLYKEWFAYAKIKDYSTEVRLADILSYNRGLSYSSEDIDCENGNDLINLKNIQSYGGFRLDGTKKYNGKYKKEQVVKEGDLVMGVTDMTQDRRTVGSVALIPNVCCVSVISADLIKLESEINNVYLYAMFRWGNVSKYISQFANGANVLHLKPQALKNIKVMLPTESLIAKYVSIVKPMFDTINKLNRANENLAKQRDALLPRLMSRKLEVQA